MLVPTIFYRRGVAHARLYIGKSALRQIYPSQRYLVRSLGPMDEGTARLYGSAWALSELAKAKTMSNEIRLSNLILNAGGVTLDTSREKDWEDLEKLGLKQQFIQAVEVNLTRAAEAPVIEEVITLKKVVDIYLEQKVPTIKDKRQIEMLEFTFKEFLPSFAFQELMKPIKKVNNLALKDLIINYLHLLPANVKNTKQFRDSFRGDLPMGLEGIWMSLSGGRIKSDYKKLSPRTIDKYVETFQAFWSFAEKAFQDMPKSPFFMVKKQVDRNAVREGKVIVKRSFTDGELVSIFSDLKFDRSWKKWIVLVAMYTGARVNEIAQLQTADVVQEIDGVYSIRFSDEGDDQQIKTDSSRRKVPIHKDLIALGFIAYWQSKVRQKIKVLFPDLKPNPDYPAGKPVSHWFNRAIRGIGLMDKEITFHSFRHTVATRLAHAGVSLRDISDITGHTPDGADKSVLSRHYIDAKQVQAMAKILDEGLVYPAEVTQAIS